ncbi:DNA-processing protein DprA [Halalkalibacter akibai]|uniref:Rossmann fold nucleotide-binding protein Smf n=1 Tax=Halalkalibacter akibai (strain ATCC 43226 / DSM 21942 / CIP 109018 / JCM 9157 / 1139) TaxID=1236973 RepID=W4QPC1_HALA3|nr:DNA-processing protein DprA [Halalkalibacter akibai]GAE33940.1 Rossmann fold nucleotide-binding protein Smf [Halalkalibacter akibai JCM 9157]
MSNQRQRLIHLHLCKELSWKELNRILTYDQQLSSIYDYSTSDWQQIFHLTPRKAQLLFHHLHSSRFIDFSSYFQSQQIHVMTVFDSDYPMLLKQIFDPPFVLYGLGNLKVLKTEQRLAVIGTRYPSQAGMEAVKMLIPPVAQNGWTIVSGMAKGIDSMAHWQTLHANGQTIAVLGSGFNYIYPKENKKLFSKLSQENLLLSEYPPTTPPQKWHFPARNRIISGLTQAVLVIEAKEKSGSLITADQALEHGRDVFAVPGSIYTEQSRGTNYLIQQGAKLITHADDILIELKG